MPEISTTDSYKQLRHDSLLCFIIAFLFLSLPIVLVFFHAASLRFLCFSGFHHQSAVFCSCDRGDSFRPVGSLITDGLVLWESWEIGEKQGESLRNDVQSYCSQLSPLSLHILTVTSGVTACCGSMFWHWPFGEALLKRKSGYITGLTLLIHWIHPVASRCMKQQLIQFLHLITCFLLQDVNFILTLMFNANSQLMLFHQPHSKYVRKWGWARQDLTGVFEKKKRLY